MRRRSRRGPSLRWDRVGVAAAALAIVLAVAWFAASRLIALAETHRTVALAQQHAQASALATGAPQAAPTIVPAPPWTQAQRDRLQARMESIFAAPVFANAGIVVLAQDGTPLFTRNARTPMTPASTLKLVVATTALEKLGPGYRFTTSFQAGDELDASGELHGPLYLVGSGDPMLVSNDLRGGAAVLAKAGLRKVDGGLRVDDRAFAGPEINPHWESDDLEEGYAPPTSAVSLDEDTVEFDVTPTTPGSPATVTVEPPNDEVNVSGSIATISESGDTNLTIDRSVTGGSNGDENAFAVDGSIPYGVTQKFWKPVRGVSGYVGGAAVRLLAERSIAVDGDAQRGEVPAGARALWLHRSPQLSQIVDEMLVDSNNHSAEQLLRTLGERDGTGGTDGAGLQAEHAMLARLGVPQDGFSVHDGSGLSPDDRIAPLTLASLLAAELPRPAGGFLIAALPRPGFEGTVRYHQLTTGLGKVHAKSGHIAGVNGLAGVEKTAHHGFITFAFLVNDPNADADAVTLGQDGAMDVLALF